MPNDPLIITCAIVGAELTRQDTPHLPLTPDELAQSAAEAVAAGARIIHLHVRDEKGRPSQRTDLFESVSRKIRDRCDCILQFSTGGAVGTPLAERCGPLSLKPDMATLSMGTLNFGPDIFENTEDTIRHIADQIRKNGVMPELEIFDAGMLDTVFRFLKRGLIPPPFYVDFVLGVPGGMAGDIENLLFLVSKLSPGQPWCVAGIGKYQLPLTAHAIAMGGHVRVGMEDNIYYRKGEPAVSNSHFVERVGQMAAIMERPVANLQETRRLLGLEGN